jgi:hypothetical protein
MSTIEIIVLHDEKNFTDSFEANKAVKSAEKKQLSCDKRSTIFATQLTKQLGVLALTLERAHGADRPTGGPPARPTLFSALAINLNKLSS